MQCDLAWLDMPIGRRIGALQQLLGWRPAHVRWWAFGGPDDNIGPYLRSPHHKLLDKGVLAWERVAASWSHSASSTTARPPASTS